MIYAMHGVARSRRADSFEHRGLLESELFESYLAAREPFVDLHCALRGGGDALTIDDATMAAADAALSALKYGHQVTLFVNGFNVKYQHPYCFSVVNWLLDHTQVKSVEIEDEHYEVATFEQRRQFRQQIKQTFRHFKDHEQESVFIETLAIGLRVEIDRLAEARVLTQDDLLKLTSRGVKLGNHGWTHTDPQRVTVNWDKVASMPLDPLNIPPEAQMKAGLPNNQGRPSLVGPGRLETVDMNPFRSGKRVQELVFELARDLTRSYLSQPGCDVPAHVLFPQVVEIARVYLDKKVRPHPPANILDVFCSPYYGWVIERLAEAIKPDTSSGEAPEVPRYERNREPISTSEVDFWTSRDVRDVINSHLNYVVADTKKWEQSAAYRIDTHKSTEAFVKNEGLSFAIPYFHNGQPHDYMPDFIIRLSSNPLRHLILETKGHDPLAEIKKQAAERWVAAVNADGTFGTWHYRMCRRPDEVTGAINSVTKPNGRE